MRKHSWKRLLAGLLSASMVLPAFPITAQAETMQTETASKVEIEEISAKAASSHGAELAVDGDISTYWQSISGYENAAEYKRNYAHNRYIDITLDGMYDLSQIKIFNNVNGSYNNYYVYASTDGVNYDKIISKTSDSVATAEGDTYEVNAEASYLRLNMAYNSNTYVTNLSEIEIYGVRTGERQDDNTGIQVEDWEDSSWQIEWDKFETDTAYAESKVLAEMSNLVGRVIGEEWKDSFQFEIRGSLQDEKDIFELKDGKDGKIVIRGNNGIAMASGFNYYLKNYVYVDYNPLFGSNVSMSEIVPVGETVVKEAQYNLRYALNFCTYSYTMAFWNWDEYEEFLDWCAMNGLNLVLDIVGQEEVLRQTFLEYNYTNEEIKDYICGPAYFAWFYMQNLYSVGGPLPDAWFEQRTELGRQIHDRMQTYGITPVLQGFSGQVPETFAQKNSGAQLAPVDVWGQHNRPALLMTYVSEGQTDYFSQVAETFYEKQKNVFGDISDYYATDPFHEDGAIGSLDVATIFETVQKEMVRSNPEAVWIIQQWQKGLDKQGGAKVSKLDAAHALVLDLQSDLNQENTLFEERKIPWLYCMLHNFGGRMGLDGQVPAMSYDPMKTYNEKNYMVGIGITPEALENSPVVYELFLETLWSKDPIDYNEWIDNYAKRRAGGDSESLQEAWDILVETAYADKPEYYQGAGETLINARPADSYPKGASTWGHMKIFYDKTELDEALRLLTENYGAFQNSEAFKYDLADVAEQVICNVAVEYHSRMVAAKNEGNLEEFEKYSTKFLELIDLSDQILSTTAEFMLGTWIEASRKMITGADDWTKDLFEFNARSLITTWSGENPSNWGLKDYSNRKWSGLTSDFYKERWEIWIRNRTAELKGESKAAADVKAEDNWFLWEYQWANRKSDDDNGKYAFTTEPIDVNLGELAKLVYDEYSYTALVRTDGEEQAKINAANGKTVSLTTGSTQSGALENVTDGDTGTEWVGTGTTNHVVEIDLEGTWSLSEFVLSIPQLAKAFPYYYKLETFNPNTNEWEMVEEYIDRRMGSNVTISNGNSYTASKIRLTMNTSDDVDSPLTITDLAAYGKELDAVEYKNLARGVQAEINVTTHSESNISYLTDGDTSTLWKTPWPYEDGYPANAVLDLGEAKYVDYVEVYFETEGRPFEFEVFVEDAEGNSIVVSDEYADHNAILPSASFRIPVQQMIRKVTVSLLSNTGQGNYYGSTPAMTEIIVMGLENEEEAVFTEGQITGMTVSGGGADDTVLDGDKTNWNVVTVDQEIVFQLPTAHYVKNVDITFEKGELGLKYQLYVEDAAGNRTLVCDKSNSMELLGTATVQIPVNALVKKFIFIHMGNNGQGPAYGAEKRLYEFEAFGGVPESIAAGAAVDVAAAAAVVDGNAETAYAVGENQQIVVTLESAADINLVSVQKKAGTEGTLKYKAEYFDEANSVWKTLVDKTEQFSTEEKIFGVAEKVVYVNQLRFTFAEAAEVAEIGIYAAEYNSLIEERINEIRAELATLNYEGYNGHYSTEAKAALEEVLTEAEATLSNRLSSQMAEELLNEINGALKTFYKKGVVYLNRGKLLALLSEADEILAEMPEEEKAVMEAAYQSAQEVYNTYVKTQAEIDSAAQALKVEIVNYRFSSTSAKAEELLENDIVYTTATQKLLEELLEEAKQAEGTAEKEAAYQKLQDAIEGLKVATATITWKSEPVSTGVSAVTGYYAPGDVVELSAQNVTGYLLLGWYKGTEKVSNTASYTYTVKESDTTLDFVAKYVEATNSSVYKNTQSKLESAQEMYNNIVVGEGKGQYTSEAKAALDAAISKAKTDLSKAGNEAEVTSILNALEAAIKAFEASPNKECKNHSWDAGRITKNPTVLKNGEKVYTCTLCGTTKSEVIDALKAPKKGTKLIYKKHTYRVTKAGKKNGTVEFYKASNKYTTITIPATIKVDGITYKVTGIASNAFKNNKKVKKLTIGKNVSKIGANAFKNTTKLKTINVKTTKLTKKSLNSKALQGISKKTTIQVPKSKLKAYKSLFKKKGLSSKVKVRK